MFLETPNEVILTMKLKLLSQQDCEALLKFELDNKDWFERFVPPRSAAYFTLSGLQNIVAELIAEQQENKCFMGLAYEGNEIIGRANLHSVSGGEAQLGYRVAKAAVGKGVATKMVQDLLCVAQYPLGISVITACTTPNNVASQAVLRNQGFEKIGIKESAVTLNGKTLDFIYFEHRLVP